MRNSQATKEPRARFRLLFNTVSRLNVLKLRRSIYLCSRGKHLIYRSDILARLQCKITASVRGSDLLERLGCFSGFFVSLHIRSMWETICDPTASLLGWLSLSDSFSQCDLVFCAFTDVTGSLSQSDLVFCSLSQSDLVFCAFTDVACGWKWPIFCTGSYPLWRLIFSIRLMF